MLAAHAIAAQMGYTGGPTRNDARAKRMAEQLVNAPPFRNAPSSGSTGATNPHSSSQSHTPGWTSSPTSSTQSQHVSIDPKGAANFGVVVKRSGTSDVVVSSSVARKRNGPPPLTMTKGPRGKITNGSKYPSTPYAGGFSDLEVTGVRKAAA